MFVGAGGGTQSPQLNEAEEEEEVTSPLKVEACLVLFVFLKSPVFMIIYDHKKIAYMCTVCVNSVPKCTVDSIFIFFFNLKKNKQNKREIISKCHDLFT